MYRYLALFTLILAFCVVVMGSYVRISDAGLGCPDWPGCYGELIVPQTAEPLHGLPFDAAKAWKEMGHRYLAGALGLLVLLLAGLAFRVRAGGVLAAAWGSLLLVGLQALLGMWTVETHVLPLAVTGHLLLGYLTLLCLYRLYLATGPKEAPRGGTRGLRWLGRFAFLVLFVQILLGGWVSSNYAALSCPDFPTCRGGYWPDADWREAFRFWRYFEPGYDGSLLPPAALVAVHYAHRLFAILAFLVLSLFATAVTSNPKVPRLSKAGMLLSFLLLVQVGLGVAAVLLRLPLAVAVAHNAVGLLLLLNLGYLQYRLRPLPRVAVPELPAEVERLERRLPEWELPLEIPAIPVPAAREEVPTPPQPSADNLYARLKNQLGKTRGGLTGFLSTLALGRKAIDRDLLDDIEAQLLMADIGVQATQDIIAHLTDNLERHELGDVDALRVKLREYLYGLLEPVSAPLEIPPECRPFVLLVVGVNGVGKTTTIGKLAKRFQNQGHSVMLAAGDTFRAAAVEQLQTWGERNQVPVVAQHSGADSASVIYDAVQSAQARGIDVLIADTAGRLHTKSNLMEELGKIKRIMSRLDPNAPHEVLLVLDAGTGQNAISQAKLFNEAVGLTGLALTKLDGTAKGGVIFALAKQFGIPIRYIGIGEGIDDLQDFEAEKFIDALFAE